MEKSIGNAKEAQTHIKDPILTDRSACDKLMVNNIIVRLKTFPKR